jgi:hypothetical protein
MRYRLRTLLIVLAIIPPLLAWLGWPIIRDYVLPKAPPSETEFDPWASPKFAGQLDPFGTPIPAVSEHDPFASKPADETGLLQGDDSDPFRPKSTSTKTADPFASP